MASMREDISELRNLDGFDTFDDSDLSFFMDMEEDLAVCEPVTESNAIEVALNSAVDRESMSLTLTIRQMRDPNVDWSSSPKELLP